LIFPSASCYKKKTSILFPSITICTSLGHINIITIVILQRAKFKLNARIYITPSVESETSVVRTLNTERKENPLQDIISLKSFGAQGERQSSGKERKRESRQRERER